MAVWGGAGLHARLEAGAGKDLITFAAHYPAPVCTHLPLCVLINQAQTTRSVPLHFST